MVVRAGFLIVALVSAIRVCQINLSRSRKRSTSGDDHENEKGTNQQEGIQKKNGKFGESKVKPPEKEEKQVNFSAEEEVKVLNNALKEKEKESWNLELRLMEMCCLKEQKSRISLLRNQLMDKTTEIGILSETIEILKAEKEKLHEELKQNQMAKKQLETAKVTILELQAKKREVDADQIEGQLMQMKEKILGICIQEKHQFGDIKVHDKKLRELKNLELKAIKMKRKNIELEVDKRELMVKLNAAQAQMAELSTMTEEKIVAKFQEEIRRLQRANSGLIQEVDKLQKDRFSFLEELVYQRWINKCLRFELEDHLSPEPKKTRPIRRSSSDMSSVHSSDELSNSSSKKMKHGLIHSIKRWGNPGRIRRFSTSSIPSSTTGVLFSSRNLESALDSSSPDEKPPERRARRVSFNDSINSIRYIYEDRPQSDHQASSETCREIPDSEAALEKKKDGFPPLTAEKLDSKRAEIPPSILSVQNKDEFAEIPSSIFSVENQDEYAGTETQVVQNRELHQAETLGSGMSDGASPVRMFCDLAVNLTVGVLTLIFILVLVYFRFISAFNHDEGIRD